MASPVVVLIGYLEGEASRGWRTAGWMLGAAALAVGVRLAPRLVRLVGRAPATAAAARRELAEVRREVLADLDEPARSRLAALPARTWLRVQIALSRLAWARLHALGDEVSDEVLEHLELEVATGLHDERLARITRRIPARYGVEVDDLRALLRALALDPHAG